jgi:hypothetical protein
LQGAVFAFGAAPSASQVIKPLDTYHRIIVTCSIKVYKVDHSLKYDFLVRGVLGWSGQSLPSKLAVI